jgi:hypothetical protein
MYSQQNPHTTYMHVIKSSKASIIDQIPAVALDGTSNNESLLETQ